MQQHSPGKQRRPIWHDLAERFADERECLASFLALEGAEVLDGEKPANLITLVNRRQVCGRNGLGAPPLHLAPGKSTAILPAASASPRAFAKAVAAWPAG